MNRLTLEHNPVWICLAELGAVLVLLLRGKLE